MSGTQGDGALDELLRHIREELTRECRQIEVRAQQMARGILREARREARQRVGKALAARRKDVRAHLVQERAAVETRLRRQRQKMSRKALDENWPALEMMLLERWGSMEARRAWAQAALRQARAQLVSEHWRVVHPASWSADERSVALTSIDADGLQLQWQADPELKAGLRIEAQGASIDATSSGLLARRDEIEGLVLAAIDAAGASHEVLT